MKKLTIMIFCFLYSPLIKCIDIYTTKIMTIQRAYYKGDYVFAESNGYPPFPAVVTAVFANNIYHLKFVAYKATTVIESSRMEPFEENVEKYEEMYKKTQNNIYKKIQIAKKQMSKGSKNKKGEKGKRSISNLESSGKQMPKRKNGRVMKAKEKCVEIDDDSFIELSNCINAKKKSIKKQTKKTKQVKMPKIDPKSKECKEILQNLAQLSPIVNDQSLFTDHQPHNYEPVPPNQVGHHQQSPVIHPLGNDILPKNYQQEVHQAIQFPQIFTHQVKQQEQSDHEIYQGKNEVKLQEIDQPIQSQNFTKTNHLNICFDLDLDDLDLSYDQLSLQEDDYQRIAQSQRYRSSKISVHSAQDNIQRLSGYLDLLLLHFSEQRKRYRPHCVLSIKKQQQMIAILQDPSIHFIHFLALNTIFKMAQFIFSYESAHPRTKQCCTIQYFNIRAKLNILSQDFRYNVDQMQLPDGVIESLKATLILYQKHTVIVK